MRNEIEATKKMYDELDFNYEVIEHDWVTIIQDSGYDFVTATHFSKAGWKMKNQKRNLKVNKSSKGRYITLNRKRYYLKGESI
jgi:hypothetical protein